MASMDNDPPSNEDAGEGRADSEPVEVPEDLRRALETWLGMDRSDVDEFVDVYTRGREVETLVETRKLIDFDGLVVRAAWREP